MQVPRSSEAASRDQTCSARNLPRAERTSFRPRQEHMRYLELLGYFSDVLCQGIERQARMSSKVVFPEPASTHEPKSN